MKDDFSRLIDRPPPERRLEAASVPEPIRAKAGLERRQAGDVNGRVATVKSTDGLFLLTVRVVK